MIDGIVSGESIDLWHEGQWRPLGINVVGVGEGEVDVAVLALSFQISPRPELEAGASRDYFYGQQVYILGFPLGLDIDGAEINRGLPIPFAKSGIISAFTLGDTKNVYIDTQANEGFSGGPVVFSPQQEPHKFRVVGVVSGYIPNALRDADGNRLANVRGNSGIALAVGVQHVTDLIDANRIGFELPAG